MSALRSWRTAIILGIAFVTPMIVLMVGHQLRWRLWLQITRVPRIDRLPSTISGYTIERLPFRFKASFARGHDIYLVDTAGRVFRGNDRTDPAKITFLGNSKIPPRMVFVSSSGTIFVSGFRFPMVRSSDGGITWHYSHDWSFWRMTEDEKTHTLYVGSYPPVKDRSRFIAKIFKSTDEGKTWNVVFADDRLNHIHSVRWDPTYNLLYMTAGDGRYRGQAYSSDRGKTWHWINVGGKQGHTDVAISERHVFWGTDDNLGRILRAPRTPVRDGKPVLWQPYHHIWWIVAHGRQIYAGTLTGQGDRKYTGAFLIASADDGDSWQRLLEEPQGSAPVSFFASESRRLSADGWLYVATETEKTFRIRHRQQPSS
jgi:hypothetical protein